MNQLQSESQNKIALPASNPAARWVRFGGANWDLLLPGLLAVVLLGLIYAEVGFLAPLRLVLGLIFVLFAPGYAIQSALFPRTDDLDGIERAGLSCGLSIAFIPLLALALDRLPWGLRLWPMAVSLVLALLLFSWIAIARRRALSSAERYIPVLNLDLKGWWAGQERSYRRLYGLVFVVLLIALLSAAAILLLPKPDEHFTEFYMLGPDGLAENYPRAGVAGQPLSVSLGIHNLEGVPASYRVEVHDGQGQIGQAAPISLSPGAAIESQLSFTPRETGQDVEVTFVLFRDDQPEPYRSLRLWLKVNPAP